MNSKPTRREWITQTFFGLFRFETFDCTKAEWKNTCRWNCWKLGGYKLGQFFFKRFRSAYLCFQFEYWLSDSFASSSEQNYVNYILSEPRIRSLLSLMCTKSEILLSRFKCELPVILKAMFDIKRTKYQSVNWIYLVICASEFCLPKILKASKLFLQS